MKKKILIVLPTLRNGGGVVSGLKNMLSLLPTERFDFYVLPLGYSGYNNVELENCKILKDNFILTAINGIYKHCENYRHKNFLWFAKVILTLLNRVKLRSLVVNILYKNIAKKYNSFDIIVAYQEGPTTDFAQYINAPLRIAWMHGDYPNYYADHKFKSEERIYSKYDKIICVSKHTLKNFIKIYPNLLEKSQSIYNLLDIQSILDNASNGSCDILFNDKIVNLISIGRLSYIKQFNLIPRVISEILKRGTTNFRWILIGDGSVDDINQIYQETQKYEINEDHFKFIGAKYNPFPYIKQSDILVSTSYSEACPYVVNEARALGIPVVSNNYPSIYEFIEDRVNGRICTIDTMAQILSELISDNKELNKLKKEAKSNRYNNDAIIRDICNLFESK